jgi:hypothetical protein
MRKSGNGPGYFCPKKTADGKFCRRKAEAPAPESGATANLGPGASGDALARATLAAAALEVASGDLDIAESIYRHMAQVAKLA